MTAALYARVSTPDQTTENQLIELRRYAEARGWDAVEYVDHGVSGAKARRPALDRLIKAARAGQVGAVVVWKLDRLGRSTSHLLATIEEFAALGVQFVSTTEAFDTATPQGKLMMTMIGAFATFERTMIVERVNAGLRRARAAGATLGRPAGAKDKAPRKTKRDAAAFAKVRYLSNRKAAKKLGLHPNTVSRFRSKFCQPVSAIKIV
jgi:DNA invertase Pin-like site-specific DNA recombinase